MAKTTIKQLLEAGVHFGHQTQRWNPKMKKYIFGERNGIYIINLEITLKCIERVVEHVRKMAESGQDILFVGTKRQAQEALREAAEGCGMPYVNQRWLGGMLTNFETIRKSLDRIQAIDTMEKDGSFQYLTKKEVGSLKKEREKLNRNLAGIRTMNRIPNAIFVIDARKEEIAIKEARKLGLAVISVLDTNCDPDLVDFPIPGNDDAIRAIKLVSTVIADAVKEGRAVYNKLVAEQEAKRAKEEAEKAAKEAAAKEAAEKAKLEQQSSAPAAEADKDQEDSKSSATVSAAVDPSESES